MTEIVEESWEVFLGDCVVEKTLLVEEDQLKSMNLSRKSTNNLPWYVELIEEETNDITILPCLQRGFVLSIQ